MEAILQIIPFLLGAICVWIAIKSTNALCKKRPINKFKNKFLIKIIAAMLFVIIFLIASWILFLPFIYHP